MSSPRVYALETVFNPFPLYFKQVSDILASLEESGKQESPDSLSLILLDIYAKNRAAMM